VRVLSNMTIDISTLKTLSQAVPELGINLDTARQYAQKGRLKTLKLGRFRFVLPEHIAEFQARNRRGGARPGSGRPRKVVQE
jgi:hypothetical protein